ncbi:hypothetical protein [Catenulispora rubra]|uniref:hypothetical protein n=1 Tax=Catenulispora rubra TaxID=280293 RepID=UPI0018922D56|nr:hypothetical protein [Catenulispora rubra]
MVGTLIVPEVLGCAAVLPAMASGVSYIRSDRDRRAALRLAWRVRATWKKTAMRVGLYQTDHASKVGSAVPLDGEYRSKAERPRTLIPAIKVRADRFGLTIEVKTIGKIGLAEWQGAAEYLAHAWRVHQVQVLPLKPGRLIVRALLLDPLTEPWTLKPDLSPKSVDLKSWAIGRDANAEPVTIRSSGVSGMALAGLAGFGKSSLIASRFCQLAPSPAVQFVFLDGKGGPDYDDLAPRAWLFGKDDREHAIGIMRQVHQLLLARQAGIKQILGVKNMWHVGPSAQWPLVVVVIDEAHTFFYAPKATSGDKASQKAVADAAEFTRLVEEVVRKGRNVGLQVLLATQKATGDAIPTQIRDNCQVAISYAQRTSEATVAILGADISEYPHAHPRRLQDAAYIGVASMVAEGRPGFTLVRTPYVSDEDSAAMADATADLVADPLELIRSQLGGPHLLGDVA